MEEKLSKRELKRATATIDGLMAQHCGLKRTPRLAAWLMPAEAYALHVQRKFSGLSDRDKSRMVTIGREIKRHTKGAKIRAAEKQVGVKAGDEARRFAAAYSGPLPEAKKEKEE